MYEIRSLVWTSHLWYLLSYLSVVSDNSVSDELVSEGSVSDNLDIW